MILEHRAYTMQIGLLERFYELQVERGFDAIAPVLDRLIGYFSTVDGPLEQVVHLYALIPLRTGASGCMGSTTSPSLNPISRKYAR